MRILYFFLSVMLISCAAPDYLSEEELHTYIQDESNGLVKDRKAGPVNVKVFYRPSDFLIWQEIEEETDTTRIKEALSRYDNYTYFMMQLSVGEKDALYGLSTNQMEFNDRLQTLSFRMNQYVNLTTSNLDTIPVADFYYSRMFGLAKSNDILFVFNNEKMEGVDWISLNTKEFGFKTGRQSFRFQLKDIRNTPGLAELRLKRER